MLLFICDNPVTNRPVPVVNRTTLTSPLRRPRHVSHHHHHQRPHHTTTTTTPPKTTTTTFTPTSVAASRRVRHPTRCVFLPPDGGNGTSSTSSSFPLDEQQQQQRQRHKQSSAPLDNELDDDDDGGGGNGKQHTNDGEGDQLYQQQQQWDDSSFSRYTSQYGDIDPGLRYKNNNGGGSSSIPPLSPMVGADQLNDRFGFNHMQRHRHTLAPEEAFGAIFTWDVVMTNGRELEQRTWELLAKERGYAVPDMDDIIRAEVMAPEAAITRVFYWRDEPNDNNNSSSSSSSSSSTDDDLMSISSSSSSATSTTTAAAEPSLLDWGEIKRIMYRKHELHAVLEQTFEWKLRKGIDQFLHSLIQYGVKCILCSYTRPKRDVIEILQSVCLQSVFSPNNIIANDDGIDLNGDNNDDIIDDNDNNQVDSNNNNMFDDIQSPQQLFLAAALKCQRPPEKCIVFTDRPADITAGHDITAKVIALIGAHPAYDMKMADHVIRDFDDLVVYNIRRLFAEEGSALPYEPQPEPEFETEQF